MASVAATKSRTRRDSTSPRTSRAGTSQENRPMIRLSSSTVAEYLVASTSTMNRNGIDKQDVDEAHHRRVEEAAHQAGDGAVQWCR